ncbi:flagellar filament capping protein FliD [Aneurinibacillus migulanus]|uniref:flagellar filament capping protein FliD n=1 Tax=Aneurinibacillus migulanus TaxID=47500 RepID=UPI002E2494B0|nr:flagellar filament capping protein FliD [Aneurinibacillus migulanus]MED4730258.1 flagellar filament capping protein FliD [Aneurinibacillus migulanus]
MSVNRITGFSGFDSESLIQKMMTAERAPLNKLKFKKQKMVWQQDMYREINTSFKSLHGMADSLKNSSTWNMFKTVSSDESSVSVSGTTASGTHKVEVLQLASTAKLEAKKELSGDTPDIGSLTPGSHSIVVDLGGVSKQVTIDVENGDDPTKVKDKLQAAFDKTFGQGNISVSADASNKLKFQTTNGAALTLKPFGSDDLIDKLGFSNLANRSTGLDPLATVGSLTGDSSNPVTFTITGKNGSKEFTIDPSDSLETVMAKVNAEGAATGVRMNYDAVAKKFTFTSMYAGAEGKVELTTGNNPADPGNKFLEGLGFSAANRGAYGTDTIAVIDGTSVSSTNNSITKDGITYDVKKVTNGTPVTIKTEHDVDALVKQITDFVNKYNEAIEGFSSKLREKVNRKILPMSDEDRKNIKEADLKLWEAEAKKGLLRNDDILSKALGDMRMITYSGVKGVRADGKDAYLSSIGITTASFTGENGEVIKSKAAMDGMLTIDEKKLRKALEENPEQVINIFTSYPTNADKSLPKEEYEAKKGLMHRFKDFFWEIQKEVSARIDNTGKINDSSLEKQIRDMNNRMEDMEVKLLRKEDQYYRRFAQMEKVMSQGSAQSSWIAAQLGKM